VVAAFEEWRHWLEGSEHTTLVWSDHKNLTFIRTARRLNSRQARWSQFLGRFSFTLTTFRNAKADALSRLHVPERIPEEPETILPASCVVGVVTMHIEAVVRRAQHTQPGPGNGPPHRLFVPNSVRSRLLWRHASRLACHPGVHRTLSFLARRFWWPSMSTDIREFVAACSICSRSKASRHPASSPCPQSSMVPHSPGLRDRPSSLPRQHGHPHSGGPVLQGGAPGGAPETPILSGDG